MSLQGNVKCVGSLNSHTQLDLLSSHAVPLNTEAAEKNKNNHVHLSTDLLCRKYIHIHQFTWFHNYPHEVNRKHNITNMLSRGVKISREVNGSPNTELISGGATTWKLQKLNSIFLLLNHTISPTNILEECLITFHGINNSNNKHLLNASVPSHKALCVYNSSNPHNHPHEIGSNFIPVLN